MATHSSILAWRIPWTQEPGRLQSMGPQRVQHDWVTNTHTGEFGWWSTSPQAPSLMDYISIWHLLSQLWVLVGFINSSHLWAFRSKGSISLSLMLVPGCLLGFKPHLHWCQQPPPPIPILPWVHQLLPDGCWQSICRGPLWHLYCSPAANGLLVLEPADTSPGAKFSPTPASVQRTS